MGEIINLRRIKKQKARDANEKIAAENRIKFGTPKHLRNVTKAQNKLEQMKLDGHKLKDE